MSSCGIACMSMAVSIQLVEVVLSSPLFLEAVSVTLLSQLSQVTLEM